MKNLLVSWNNWNFDIIYIHLKTRHGLEILMRHQMVSIGGVSSGFTSVEEKIELNLDIYTA